MNRLSRGCWLVAVVTTGIVAGFMLSHALVLGRFLDWLLASGAPGGGNVLSETYPVFARTAGRAGLAWFYALAGLQVLAGLAFLVVSLGSRSHRSVGAIVAVTALLWPAVHYGSGFGGLEAQVLRGTAEVSADVAERFLRWNVPIHFFHAGALTVGLLALLSIPLSTWKARGRLESSASRSGARP